MSRLVLAALALVALVLVGCVPRIPIPRITRVPTPSFKPPPTTFKPAAFKPPAVTRLPRLPPTMTQPEMEAALQGAGRKAAQTPARGGKSVLDQVGDVGPDVIQNLTGGDDKEDRRPPRPR